MRARVVSGNELPPCTTPDCRYRATRKDRAGNWLCAPCYNVYMRAPAGVVEIEFSEQDKIIAHSLGVKLDDLG